MHTWDKSRHRGHQRFARVETDAESSGVTEGVVLEKPPERREVRLRYHGKQIEFWSYVTDYARRIDSTITFIDARGTEIRATEWREAD